MTNDRPTTTITVEIVSSADYSAWLHLSTLLRDENFTIAAGLSTLEEEDAQQRFQAISDDVCNVVMAALRRRPDAS